jgi:hypothetical protein
LIGSAKTKLNLISVNKGLFALAVKTLGKEKTLEVVAKSSLKMYSRLEKISTNCVEA